MNARDFRTKYLAAAMAAILFVAFTPPAADAIVFCAKQDKADPTQPKDKSKIKIREGVCDPTKKEVEVRIKHQQPKNLGPGCGDGLVSASEDCEPTDLQGETCATQGFSGGTLTCSGCYFDTDGCFDARFIANDDGTITDRDTCLMWETKTGTVNPVGVACGQTGCPDPHDVNNIYRYCQDESPFDFACDNPGNPPDGGLFQNFIARLNGLYGPCFAGYCDWRAPNLGEQLTMFDGTCAGGSPCTAWDSNDAAYGSTGDEYVHSAVSEDATNTANKWCVSVGGDAVSSNPCLKGGLGGYARAIRTIPGCTP
jgi:hypothetical protein